MPAELDATTGAGGAGERGVTGVRASDVVDGDCGTGEGDVRTAGADACRADEGVAGLAGSDACGAGEGVAGIAGADDCKAGEGGAGDTESDELGADGCATWGVAVSG